MTQINIDDLPHWLAETVTMQEKAGEPLTDADIDMFLMFDREGWSYEQRMRHLIDRRLHGMNAGDTEGDRIVESLKGPFIEMNSQKWDEMKEGMDKRFQEREEREAHLYEKVKSPDDLIGGMDRKEFFCVLSTFNRFKKGTIPLEPSFDPEDHGFVLLWDHLPPNAPYFYEYRNHASVDGRSHMQRMNVFLTQDGEFVTIWEGFLDCWVMEFYAKEHGAKDRDWDKMNEELFRGCIQDDEHAKQILKAFRMPTVPQVYEYDEETQSMICSKMTENVE